MRGYSRTQRLPYTEKAVFLMREKLVNVWAVLDDAILRYSTNNQVRAIYWLVVAIKL